MNVELERVTIWIGRFDTDARREAYMHEEYTDDDVPISEFARDQRVRFYPHDFVESSFRPVTEDLRELFAGHSYSRSYFEAAKAVYDRLTPRLMNTVILAWGYAVPVASNARGEGYELTCLGTFACDPKASALSSLTNN